MIKKYFGFYLFILFAVSMVDCGKKGITTAEKLAEALKQQGLHYQTLAGIYNKMRFAKIDEAIALKSDSFWVEIFRIENLKGYNLAVQAVKMRIVVERTMKGEPQEIIEDAFFKHPFMVIVKQEPERGWVKQILINKIFPTISEQINPQTK